MLSAPNSLAFISSILFILSTLLINSVSTLFVILLSIIDCNSLVDKRFSSSNFILSLIVLVTSPLKVSLSIPNCENSFFNFKI